MGKKVYHISGFDCPNCATKTENFLNKQEEVEYCHIDFSTNKMYMTFKEKELSNQQILALIAKVESDPIELHEAEGNFEQNKKIFTKDMWFILARVIFGVAVIVTLLLLDHIFKIECDSTGWIRFGVYTLASIILTYDVTWRVAVHIKNRQNIIDHNLLITITVLGATALAIISILDGNVEKGPHYAMEGTMVVALFQIGQIIEKVATNRSKAAIMSAIQLRVEYANLVENDQIIRVNPEQLNIGDIVAISAGEMIPIDGEVVEGSAYVDKSSLTGEFVPTLADVDNKEVLAGCLIKSGFIKVKVLKKYEDSAVAKIIELISTSGEKKSKADEFIGKFSRFYTPAIVILSILVFGILSLINMNTFSTMWKLNMVRALEVLVTGCPCAIVISVPLAYFAGLGLASKNGIVIKGTNYLDEINNINKVVTDKTGTLTHGVFTIQKIVTADGVNEEELMSALYAAECLSTHPIAKAICHDVDIKALAAKQRGFREIAGNGVMTDYENDEIYAGSALFMKKTGVEVERNAEQGTVVYCQKNSKYLGYVVLNDEVKKEAYQMVNLLHKEKMEVILLTGDKNENALALQQELNLDRVYSELTPEQKTLILEQEMAENKKNVAFVGDGINDAPSIIRSDVGFAMGAIGSDIAVQSADVIIMNDDPAKVYDTVKIARIARFIAVFNIVFALLIKFAVMLLVVLYKEEIPMMIPVIADTGLTVVLVLNSLFILYRKIKRK